MNYNEIFLFVAALIPLIIGFIWYNPMVFGKVWMKVSNLTEADMKRSNLALIFGLTYVLGLFIAAGLMGIVIHQQGIYSLFADNLTSGDVEIKAMVNNIMDKYGDKHRSFGHGALHGGIAAIMLALPVVAINALFERRSWKYIAIHAGYWFVTLTLMGGLICQFV